MSRIDASLRDLKLPSLPRAALRVFQLAQAPDVDFHELTAALEMEPAIASRIVRLSNSSLFGLSREVTSVRQALVVLGLRTVKLAIISTTAAMAFPRREDDTDLVECWRRILTNAAGCRLIAPHFNIDPEEAFLAGMMQDITMLLLIDSLDDVYRELLREVKSDSARSLTKIEQQALGTTHAALGSRLLQEWQFPQVLLDAVEHHHDRDPIQALKEEVRELPVLMGIAEGITEFLLSPSRERFDRFDAISHCFQESVRADESVLDKVVQRLETYVSEMAELLELHLPCGKSYQQKIMEFHESASALASGISLYDAPSGLLHRDGLLIRLRQELSLAKRHGWSLSVLVFGIDRLLESSTHIPPAELLRRIGEDLQHSLRVNDSLYRYGAGSILLVANNVGTEGVTTLLGRAHAIFWGLVPAKGKEPSPIAVDMAAVVALAPIDLLDEESLLGYVDRNLQQAASTQSACVTEVDS